MDSVDQPVKAGGSPALVVVKSSHEVHPTVCNCPTGDNIELHLPGERETRMLRKGDHFELHYLLLANTRPNDYTWIEEAVEKAKPV